MKSKTKVLNFTFYTSKFYRALNLKLSAFVVLEVEIGTVEFTSTCRRFWTALRQCFGKRKSAPNYPHYYRLPLNDNRLY
jgi:hypothetical protein